LRWFLFVLVVGFAASILINSLRIMGQAARDEARPADVIVVFGAAEYAGRPSPVFRARLDHGYTLFARGVAPLVIVTGGAGGDPKYSEGGVGHHYLQGRGVPDRNLIAETQGDNTAESAERVAAIMRANRLRTCVAVSDAYHLFRIKKLLERHGVLVYGSPRPESRPQGRWARFGAVLREALSYTVWRLRLIA
jgi:uncharacterized SAM-binding protein YcdF (DUF218 family)